jgi:hypothetical protein
VTQVGCGEGTPQCSLLGHSVPSIAKYFLRSLCVLCPVLAPGHLVVNRKSRSLLPWTTDSAGVMIKQIVCVFGGWNLSHMCSLWHAQVHVCTLYACMYTLCRHTSLCMHTCTWDAPARLCTCMHMQCAHVHAYEKVRTYTCALCTHVLCMSMHMHICMHMHFCVCTQACVCAQVCRIACTCI